MDTGLFVWGLVPVFLVVVVFFIRRAYIRIVIVTLLIILQALNLQIGGSIVRRNAKTQLVQHEDLNDSEYSLLKKYDVILAKEVRHRFVVDLSPILSLSLLILFFKQKPDRNKGTCQ